MVASAFRLWNDSLPKESPTHTVSVNRNLAAHQVTANYRKQTLVWLHPEYHKRGNYSMERKYYGIDVSKETLDIACEGAVVRIGNNVRDIKTFIKSVPAGSVVGMEATNTYHLAAADACHVAGMRVYVVNPRVTRHYREVMSLRGHTDRMDALTLAHFIEREHEQLRAYLPKSADERRLQTLIRRRSKLVEVKGQLQQSMGAVKDLKADLEALTGRIEKMIGTIEYLIDKLLEGNADRARIATIKGVGPVVSAALVSDLQGGDFRRADSFVAFYGLDPRPNDSGRCRGRRKLSKQGQRLGRTLLYNAAMSAVRSKVWRPIYERYLERGLSKVQALIVIARKIARTAWSIYTYKTTFSPARLTGTLT